MQLRGTGNACEDTADTLAQDLLLAQDISSWQQVTEHQINASLAQVPPAMQFAAASRKYTIADARGEGSFSSRTPGSQSWLKAPTRGVSATLKYKFWPITEAVMDTQVMLIVAMETTCVRRAAQTVYYRFMSVLVERSSLLLAMQPHARPKYTRFE